jgi:alkylhydroperoxidase family enzyme
VVERIDDAHEAADLPPRVKAALRFADRFVQFPSPPSPEQQRDLDDHFSPGEQTELALGLGLFHGFSKMLIVLGLEPAQMDTTILPTPPAPTDDAPSIATDPLTALLADRPDLAARWGHLNAGITDEPPLPLAALVAAKSRVAELLGATWLGADGPPETDELDETLRRDVVGLAELFVIDVRAVTDDDIASLVERIGAEGVVHLTTALAVWDGIHRMAVTLRTPAPT